ncbi:hypothetical protein BC830DRAFT_1168888 [Chytriomyces sp. MP71]|nr:hypothetical protein BC830DRAFT_1168888 [Chytriomyces sp. MP71]
MIRALHRSRPTPSFGLCPAAVFSSSSAPRAKFCPYKTLGVSTTSDTNAIKKAYYAKVFTLHPDRLAAQPGGAPKPGTKEHATKTAEFIQTVKSFEILSDEKRRKLYDLDSARGDTGRYAREAQGKSPDEPNNSARPNYNWDPRYDNPYGRTDKEYATGSAYGEYYSPYYRGPMNTGPIYMANWKMGLLIVGVGFSCSFMIFQMGLHRIRKRRELDATESMLWEEYLKERSPLPKKRAPSPLEQQESRE